MSEKMSAMDRFLDKHPDARLHGFFWRRDDSFHVVVLATVGGGFGNSETVEFSAATPELLIEVARDGGFELPEAAEVGRLCRTAAASPRRKSPPRVR